MSDLTSPQNLGADRLDLAIYNSVRYLGDVTAMETELDVVYEQAELIIQNAWMTMKEATADEALAWANASLQP